MKKLLIITLGILIIVGGVTAFTLPNSKFFPDPQKITPNYDWRFNHVSYEEGISVEITPINATDLEITITNTNGGGYKFHSVICGLDESIEKLEYNERTDVWTNTGALNKDLLLNYGLPNWCEEGHILFSSSSSDRKLILHFTEKEKYFTIFTGTGTDQINVGYSAEEVLKGLEYSYFNYEPSKEKITRVRFDNG